MGRSFRFQFSKTPQRAILYKFRLIFTVFSNVDINDIVGMHIGNWKLTAQNIVCTS